MSVTMDWSVLRDRVAAHLDAPDVRCSYLKSGATLGPRIRTTVTGFLSQETRGPKTWIVPTD